MLSKNVLKESILNKKIAQKETLFTFLE